MRRSSIVGCVLTLCFAAVFSSSIVHAEQTYRFEAGASYLAGEDDDSDHKAYGLSLGLHFLPVKTDGHPLAEAAFMERIGNVSVAASMAEFNSHDRSFDADGVGYGVNLFFAMPDLPIAGWGAYGRAKTEYDANPNINDISSDFYRIGLGAYIMDGLLVSLIYDCTEMDISLRPNSPAIEGFEQSTYSLKAKWVVELINDKAINVEGGVSRQEVNNYMDATNTEYSLSTDYYFTSRISLGASFALNDGEYESAEGNIIGIRSRIFFTQNFSILGLYSYFSTENDRYDDSHSYGISASLRF